jgi:RNA polymerase sigma-70 factor (ECF subfamily)
VNPISDSSVAGKRFEETAWSVVIAAGADSSPRAHHALAELCRAYWPPIYGYLRRHGYDTQDAQDLTQSFFQHMLEDETLRRASRDKGRFRNFLLGALKICLADEQARRHTLKRGGNFQMISVDALEAEELHHLGMAEELSPAELLDARSAGLLLDRALATVRANFGENGKAAMFEALAPFLAGEKPDICYEDVAEHLGVGRFPDTSGNGINLLGRGIAIYSRKHIVYIPKVGDLDVATLDANTCCAGHVSGCHVKIVQKRMGGFPVAATVDEGSETVYVANEPDGTVSVFPSSR